MTRTAHLPREAGILDRPIDPTAGRFITKGTKKTRRAQRNRGAALFVFFVDSFVSFVMNPLRGTAPKPSPE
ncbi:hypothetical protein N0B44_22115 [Roseibacterium beibuensis]|uniref:hypothetical protein n=1 Tax=[Roseibacterium] beibuensis TaxID=1193142 RepID=UPI00217CC50F|nr:hypothetical protein [Roseibacterium beibuensis]MCS6625613.1 hypothetical protein [Roseibacterium beibuensis]